MLFHVGLENQRLRGELQRSKESARETLVPNLALHVFVRYESTKLDHIQQLLFSFASLNQCL